MNDDVKIFINGLRSYKIIYDDIKKIIENEHIGYFNDKSSYKIDFKNYISSHADIVITFEANSIPFSVIHNINKYMGVECSYISCSVGHNMNLHYTFSKDNNR